MDPAAAVLHYAQEVFEGLKAYRTSRWRRDPVPAAGERPPFPELGRAAGHADPPEKLFLEAVDRLSTSTAVDSGR